MKKIFLIILINFLIFLTLFLSLEYKVFINNYPPENISFFSAYSSTLDKSFSKLVENLNSSDSDYKYKFRNNIYKENYSFDILLLGCSYTWGPYLQNEETFSFKLQEFSRKNVINKAFMGWGINNSIYLLNDEKIISSIPNPSKVKYVIYTFIDDHVKRMFITSSYFDNSSCFYDYDYRKDLLVKKPFYKNLYWNSYVLRSVARNIIAKDVLTFSEKSQIYLLKHFKELSRLVRKNFKNSQLVLFVFDGDKKIKTVEADLLNLGIKIVYLSSLSDVDFLAPKYVVDEWGHPSAYAWDVIVPLLSKELKL